MKTIISIYVIFPAVLIGFCTPAGAQENNNPDGDVTLIMADGTKKRGWGRTAMINEVKFFEISDTPKGKRVRYDKDQIERIEYDEGAVYVKQDYFRNLIKRDKMNNVFMRLDYQGDGIMPLSAYLERLEVINNRTHRVKWRNYYMQHGDDPTMVVAVQYYQGGKRNNSNANRKMQVYSFSKVYPQYAEFAKRIHAKEFDTTNFPIDVAKAWEEAYRIGKP